MRGRDHQKPRQPCSHQAYRNAGREHAAGIRTGFLDRGDRGAYGRGNAVALTGAYGTAEGPLWRRRACWSKNSTWLTTALTASSRNGLVIKNVGSGRSPVISLSG